MTHLIRWIAGPRSGSIELGETPTEALDFACSILPQNPSELFVVNPEGVTIADLEKIRDHCVKRELHTNA